MHQTEYWIGNWMHSLQNTENLSTWNTIMTQSCAVLMLTDLTNVVNILHFSLWLAINGTGAGKSQDRQWVGHRMSTGASRLAVGLVWGRIRAIWRREEEDLSNSSASWDPTSPLQPWTFAVTPSYKEIFTYLSWAACFPPPLESGSMCSVSSSKATDRWHWAWEKMLDASSINLYYIIPSFGNIHPGIIHPLKLYTLEAQA